MGNGLFQIAATIGYAKKHNVNCVLPKWEHTHAFQLPLDMFKDLNTIKSTTNYEEPRFAYSEIPFKQNCNLHGYFQSWRYFGHCEEYIRHVLAPDRKSTRLNSSHVKISYAVFCLKKKK